MLMKPMMEMRMPAAMTRDQYDWPRDLSEVAVLLRLPRMETPRIIIRTPRVTKPEDGESRGQLVAM